MSDNRTMGERRFTELPDMSDYEFAQFCRKHDLTYRQHLIGSVWMDRGQNSFAVVTYDNEKCTRKIFIKSDKI